MSNQGEIVDTGQGVLQGVQPAQPRMAGDWQQQRPDQAVTQQQPGVYLTGNTGSTNGQPSPRWTDDDLERVRQQEKDKLYPRIEEMSTQLRQIQEAREAEMAERQRLADEAAEVQRQAEEQELNARDLILRKEQEWHEQFQSLQSRYEQDRAVFERERTYNEVQEYKRNRIEQERQSILPELQGMVTGDSFESVDSSIETLKGTSLQILENMVAASQQPPPFAAQRGASPTAPSVGPMEQIPAYESLTPEDIRTMDMETYKKYRGQLLQATNPNRR